MGMRRICKADRQKILDEFIAERDMESLTAVRAPPCTPRFYPWRQGGVRVAPEG